MIARRHSTRLAMAVSSILAAPALATGFGLLAGIAMVPEARAQETAGQLGGVVVDAKGNPVAGATVEVKHLPSGTTSTVTTNASGQFVASGLRIGGPYTVTATSSGYQGAAVRDVYTELGRRANLTLTMNATAQLAEVQVTAAGTQTTAVGVSSDFSAQTIAEVPTIDRDLKSTLQLNPMAWVDPSNSDALEVAGVNNRYNSFTVDGVRQDDDFGLNNNGYPTQYSPISLDAVQQVSLLTAPFDVQYSGFRGSTINVVTKSGTNEFHGSAYYYKSDDGMAGKRSQDTKFNNPFSEKRYGATLGGPIIQDKLFFFLSYEKLDRQEPQNFGPAGSGAPTEVSRVSQADYNQIVQITRDVYNFDPGERRSSLPVSDEKYLGKLDWNITDTQRASFTYQRTVGNAIIQTNNNPTYGELSTPSDWYNRKITLDAYSLQLFSDWTDTFRTEFKAARKKVETLQDSLGGTNFALFRVTTSDGGTVFIGPDVYRQANYLKNDADEIKFKASWFLGNHTLAAGYERNMLDIFNLFVPYSTGEYRFSSISDYQNRFASQLAYSNAYTNNAADNGAKFGYNVDSLYLQDQWQVTPDLSLQAGLRYEKYSSGDKPTFNQNFYDRYGFSNQHTLDGLDVLMPRFSFNWQADPDTLVRGGLGLFAGGTPNVWISNSYSNDGVTYVAAPNFYNLTNVDGYNIPRAVQDSLAAGDGQVSAVAPNFKIPAQWRVDLGIEHYFPGDWKLTADLMHSKVQHEVLWQDYRLVVTGTAPDGRPIYGYRASDNTRPRNYRVQDMVLTNTSQGESTIFSTDLTKSWQTVAGRFDLYLAYAHQHVTDVNPGTSSIASSNWKYLATDDPNNPKVSTSNYQIEHRFVMMLNWKKAFFADAFTKAGLVFTRRSGRPYSYTYGSGTYTFGDPQAYYQRSLLYVPLANDPLVTYSSPAFESAVNAFIDGSRLAKYRGQIAPRNAFTSPWVSTLDLHLAQEIPLGWKELKGEVTFDVLNLANLINNDWGRVEQVNFPYVWPVLNASINSAGQYVYSPINSSNPVPNVVNKFSNNDLQKASVWRLQLGFRIKF